jgi:hypothetical protein
VTRRSGATSVYSCKLAAETHTVVDEICEWFAFLAYQSFDLCHPGVGTINQWRRDWNIRFCRNWTIMGDTRQSKTRPHDVRRAKSPSVRFLHRLSSTPPPCMRFSNWGLNQLRQIYEPPISTRSHSLTSFPHLCAQALVVQREVDMPDFVVVSTHFRCLPENVSAHP